MKLFTLSLAAVVGILCVVPVGSAPAADSVQAPVPVEADGTAADVPVGTVMAWPSSSPVASDGKWLECDGRTLDAARYPDLTALVGGRVPDYRGLFLRGLGGGSGALGVIQQDQVGAHSHTLPAQTSFLAVPDTGALAAHLSSPTLNEDAILNLKDSGIRAAVEGGAEQMVTESFGGDETRPANMAVRYYIRALP